MDTNLNMRVVKGINSQTLPGLAAEAVVESAASAGLDAVEIAGEAIRSVPRLEKALAASGLQMLGLCPTSRVYDWHLRWSPALEHALGAELEVAAGLGSEYYVMPFMKPGGDGESVSSGLARAVRIAAPLGVRLAVEPIGHHAPLNTAQALAPILARQDAERVGLLLDTFHFFRVGQHLDDLSLYDDVPILALQVSNSNGAPLDGLLGYRDRTFPLDGPFQVVELCERVLTSRREVPVIVEVIGDVARSLSAEEGMALARSQLDQIVSRVASKEATGV